MLHETLELRGFPQSQRRRLEWCNDVRCFDLTPGSGTEWLRRVHDGPTLFSSSPIIAHPHNRARAFHPSLSAIQC